MIEPGNPDLFIGKQCKLHAWETGSDARTGIANWVEFYSHKRPHSAHGGRPPAVVCWLEKDDMQTDQPEQTVA